MKTLEELRKEVLEKGQKTNDRTKVSSKLLSLPCSLPLLIQIQRDGCAGYKYYDALCMWLGQEEHWTERDKDLLRMLAEEYLGGER